jgi:D-alanyl-D-alanine endopeptidase (penicillin-binding protein 7)
MVLGVVVLSPATANATRRVHAHAHAKSAKTLKEAPSVPSFGQLDGLRTTEDPIGLQSSVALVMDEETSEVLVSKNSQAVLPIASLTKLMTALVVTAADQPSDEVLTITDEDVDHLKHSSSRLAVGTHLTRGEMLHLALMASENRAAHALARNYPGGLEACVAAMNAKAAELGMDDTRYVEPTGLSSRNQSSAQNLAKLVEAANRVATIRELSTSDNYLVAVGRRIMTFHSTNALVRSHLWQISVQKTGYIAEAGRCMVMRVQMAGHQLVMVLLDAAGGATRAHDAERVRSWVTQTYALRASTAAPAPMEPPAIPGVEAMGSELKVVAGDDVAL